MRLRNVEARSNFVLYLCISETGRLAYGPPSFVCLKKKLNFMKWVVVFLGLLASCDNINKIIKPQPCPPHDTIYVQGHKYDTARETQMQFSVLENNCFYILTFETFNVLDSIHAEVRPYFDTLYVTYDTTYHRDTTYIFEIVCNDTTLAKRDSSGWVFYNYGKALEAVYKSAIVQFERSNQ